MSGAFARSLLIHLLIGLAMWLALRPRSEIPPMGTTVQAPVDVSLNRPASPANASAPAGTVNETAAAADTAAAAPRVAVADPGTNVPPSAGAYDKIRASIDAHLRYPLSLRRRGVTGTVNLLLQLNSAGELARVDVAQSSGHSELDAVALQAARDASPFGAQGQPRTIRIPIVFRLQ